MTHPFRSWLFIAAWTATIVPGTPSLCRAGDPLASGAQTLPVPSPVQERLPAYVLPPPPPDYPAVSEDRGGVLLLDRPDAEPPGIFFNVESSVVWPHLRNELVGGAVTLAQTSGVSPVSSVGLPPGAGMPITGDLVK